MQVCHTAECSTSGLLFLCCSTVCLCFYQFISISLLGLPPPLPSRHLRTQCIWTVLLPVCLVNSVGVGLVEILYRA